MGGGRLTCAAGGLGRGWFGRGGVRGGGCQRPGGRGRGGCWGVRLGGGGLGDGWIGAVGLGWAGAAGGVLWGRGRMVGDSLRGGGGGGGVGGQSRGCSHNSGLGMGCRRWRGGGGRVGGWGCGWGVGLQRVGGRGAVELRLGSPREADMRSTTWEVGGAHGEGAGVGGSGGPGGHDDDEFARHHPCVLRVDVGADLLHRIPATLHHLENCLARPVERDVARMYGVVGEGAVVVKHTDGSAAPLCGRVRKVAIGDALLKLGQMLSESIDADEHLVHASALGGRFQQSRGAATIDRDDQPLGQPCSDDVEKTSSSTNR